MTAKSGHSTHSRYEGEQEPSNVALCACGAILAFDTKNGRAVESCGRCGYSAPIVGKAVGA